MRALLPSLFLFGLVACSGSAASTPATENDAGSTVVDTGSVTPESSAPDGTSAPDATVDSAVVDSVVFDGDAGLCHGVTFGKDAVTITKVATLPAMTGGTIPFGLYDATGAQTTGSITGTYRATWSFVDKSKLDTIEQLVIGAMPPPPSVRSLTWSTSANEINRKQVCNGSTSFSNQYTVRTSATGTVLEVRQESVMFTFTKRP